MPMTTRKKEKVEAINRQQVQERMLTQQFETHAQGQASPHVALQL